jgi:hypothetical protein
MIRTVVTVIVGMVAWLGVATAGSFFVRAREPGPIGAPSLTIAQAIDAAGRCVPAPNVRLLGSFVEAARFERDPRGDRGPVSRVN